VIRSSNHNHYFAMCQILDPRRGFVKRDQIWRVRFLRIVQSGASKLRIALFALSVALVATGAHAQDACSCHATFNAMTSSSPH
jgi:hypothetical protein